MQIELSFDDGDQLDTKVIDLLNKYDFQATFYIPVMSWGFDNLGTYKGHLIGGHTISHPQNIRELDEKNQRWQIQTGKDMLEQQLGNKVKSFCYPRGRYSDLTVKIVKEAGFEEARTTEVLKTSYKDPYRKPTTVHLYPFRKEYEKNHWYAYAEKLLNPDYFHAWGHSWEIESYTQWDRLDQLLKRLDEYRNSS